MVFIRFQYPLQRHFVVLVVAGLVVDITIMQAPIAIHRFMFIPMVLQDLSVGLLQVPNKQWGFTVFDPVYYKNVNFTLPLSVNGTFCAFSTGYDAKGSTFLWHSMSHFNNVNVGVTGFVFDSRYTFTGLGYLAVCWQKQWGYSNSTGVTFPIAFRECYAVVSNAHSNTTGNTDHYHLLSWTATGAAFGYWNMSFYGTLYIALGVE